MSKATTLTYTEADEAGLDPELVRACAADPFVACKTMLKVSDKEGRLVPCEIRPLIAQHYEASGEVSLWLKSRQEYLTTSIDALFYMDMMNEDGMKVLGLNLNEEKAQENFRRVLTFEDNRHPILKELHVSLRNSEELGYVETRGYYKTATIKNDSTAAQADLVARSGTYHRVRNTEAAFQKHYKVIKKAVLASMPRTNRKFVAETTGNGAQGGFYEDFMEVVTYGKPHPTIPNMWVMGNVSAHFLAWFQHHEYRKDFGGIAIASLPQEVRQALEEHEREHVEEMERFRFPSEEIERRLAWRRQVMADEYNLMTDPAGACKAMNREYPANYRHAFQSTGAAWFSLSLVDSLREFWKKENDRLNLPRRFDLVHVKGEVPKLVQGNKFMGWVTPERGWKYRYCGFLDPAAGHEDGDRAAFGILDRVLRMVVAGFHGAFEPGEAAEMAMALGAWFDYAHLSWENDGLGLACTQKFIEMQYTNLYKGEPDRLDLGAYGWNTGPLSRKVMVSQGKVHFEHRHTPVRMPMLEFYREAANFQAPVGKPDRPAAVTGHDDLVMMYCGLIVTDESMPAPEAPSRAHTMKPGEASVTALAGVTQGYRAEAQKRARGLKNY